MFLNTGLRTPANNVCPILANIAEGDTAIKSVGIEMPHATTVDARDTWTEFVAQVGK
jgi:hypothetical protein